VMHVTSHQTRAGETPLDVSPLNPDELARRLVAARELRGLSQEALGERMLAEGFGRHDAARIERGDPRVPVSPARRRGLAEVLQVPEWWFTAETLTFDGEQNEVTKLLEAVVRSLGRLHEKLDRSQDQRATEMARIDERIEAVLPGPESRKPTGETARPIRDRPTSSAG
jgi:transcriptional regulator with XRE-family HTH domain